MAYLTILSIFFSHENLEDRSIFWNVRNSRGGVVVVVVVVVVGGSASFVYIGGIRDTLQLCQ